MVQVYSFGEADGRLYIASQLIPDGDLGQMLADHGLPPVRIAVNLISQVADGLADAHAAGLIHRDIKPANVLLRHRDHELQAYLGDFGIARQLGAESGLTQAGGTVGTPSYMAPELHLGGKAGTASDVYSLGCLLWATLSGRAPYAGGTDYQVDDGPRRAAGAAAARDRAAVARDQPGAAHRDGQGSPRTATRRPRRCATTCGPSCACPTTRSPAAPRRRASAAVAPPTPRTPTPTPTPGAKAPAAPPFRSDDPVDAALLDAADRQLPRLRLGGPARRQGSGWIIAAVVVLVLLAGAITAVVLLAGDSDESGAPSGPTSTAASESTGAEPTEPTEPVGGRRPAPGPAARGAGGRGAGRGVLRATAPPTPAAAECFAQQYVDSYGVDRLVEAGVLDEDLDVRRRRRRPTTRPPTLLLGGIGAGHPGLHRAGRRHVLTPVAQTSTGPTAQPSGAIGCSIASVPPSTYRQVPTISDAASESRNAIGAAISSARPSRPIAVG